MFDLLQQSCRPHLGEHVETIVAGSAVRAQTDLDTGGHQLDDGGNTRSKFQIGRWTVGDAGSGTLQNLNLRGIEVNTMGEHDVVAGQTTQVQVGDIVVTSLSLHQSDLFQAL